jgi:hypothetical protein
MSTEPVGEAETEVEAEAPCALDPREKWRQRFVAASSLAFVASLALPALQVRGESGFGISYFLIGWLGPIGAEFGWFANPWIWFANKNILAGNYRSGSIYAAMALALILFLRFRGTILVDEGGGRSRIESFEIGYWMWVISALISLAGARWLHVRLGRKSA